MNKGIFLIDDGEKKLTALLEMDYESEEKLQAWIAEYPDLLPGDQIDRDDPRRWLLLKREAGVPDAVDGFDRWSCDHVFIDQDAIPTFVEVKRSSDTRLRREVVGQMFDYAANATAYWPAGKLEAEFRTQCAAGTDPVAELVARLNPADPETFWERARKNLEAGNIRLLFVSDRIPPELKRIVEFLNQQMERTEVLAVEIRKFSGGTFNTLVPTVYGQTEQAQQRKATVSKPARQWDEATFFDDVVQRLGPGAAVPARKLLEWSQRNTTRIWWGRGATMGSFIPVLQHDNVDYQLFAVYGNGTVEVHFQYLRTKSQFASVEKRLELLGRVNSLDGVSIGPDRIEGRPSVGLDVLARGDNTERFLAVCDWVVEEIRNG